MQKQIKTNRTKKTRLKNILIMTELEFIQNKKNISKKYSMSHIIYMTSSVYVEFFFMPETYNYMCSTVVDRLLLTLTKIFGG